MPIRLIVLIAGGIGLVAVRDYLPKWLMVLLLFALFLIGDTGSGWDDAEALPKPVRSTLAMIWLGGASLFTFMGALAGLSVGGDLAKFAAAGVPLGLAGFALLAVWLVARLLRD